MKGFCCLFKSLIQYFYISVTGPSSVCHQWKKPHFSSSFKGHLFLKGCSFIFLPWTSLLQANMYMGMEVIHLFLSSRRPLIELSHLNSSTVICMTSKEKFSEILRVYNGINFKGAIIVREGWKCHHFNSRSY